ncbi:DEAD/DEAH box helicase [Paenibacillus sp. ACRRX]|uniref:DEAD/DEAH box helicase n=1 Tax=unclassified Paenibacillus TaxID=185978 RepID=UPI001EF699DF|nr:MULTISPECIES: DEAD/DEAH box helicase [unclassified Paenibacillus]MCG7408715.1 DEAD/DEAH box helicase [Paenibacillus sp. ACRRX]MDK8183482.1 DEAD/DEAH box helicase [Paenibacillus sp. UMB4589-SE434]
MSYTLSISDIKSLCGTTSYRRGETYFKEHRVRKVQYNAEDGVYEAVVRGSEPYQVQIVIQSTGKTNAVCSCPAYSTYPSFCKHIAAVLLDIRSVERGEQASIGDREVQAAMNQDTQVTTQLISLFDRLVVAEEEEPLQDDRMTVRVEFTCKTVIPQSNKPLLAVELKLGLTRLYVIPNLKEFLAKVLEETEYAFSKSFTWDPTLYKFGAEDLAVMQLLMELSLSEMAYREAIQSNWSGYSVSSYFNQGRMLFIPPNALDRLLPLLEQAQAKFEHLSIVYDELKVINEPLPISFSLVEAEQGHYQLDINGLEQVYPLDSYQMAVANGCLYRLRTAQLTSIEEMKQLLNTQRQQMLIAPSQIEPFMDRVVPELQRIGLMKVAPTIEARLVRIPLQAQLYLDREGSRLLAKLTYVYDDVVIEPMGADLEHEASSERILLRDTRREDRIMRLFEQSAFKYNGNALYMDHEEDIVYFWFVLLPQLQRLVNVYTKPELQAEMRTLHTEPKLNMDIDSRMNWLDVQFELDGVDEKELSLMLHHLVEKKKYYRMSDGAYVMLDQPDFQQIRNMLEELGIRKSDIRGNRFELSVTRGFSLLEEPIIPASVKLGRAFNELLEHIRNPGQLEFPVPESLDAILRDYQKVGYQWMKTIAHYRFGGILADDMGLGKTLQGIAFLLAEPKEEEAKLPALIVAPASLLYNWKNELTKFAPQLTAVVVSGDKQVRSEMLDQPGDTDVYITSYPLLRRDIDQYAEQRFRTLILDEAQAIKNHSSQTAQVVKQLQAAQRFALTGTPVENRLEELWSIFDAVFPDLFTSKKSFMELSREQIARKVRPFILRRMKSDVLQELPEKIETLQQTELLPEQKKLYMAYLMQLQRDTKQQLQAEGFQKSRIKILAGLTRLRQLCCHPSLFIENYGDGSGKLELLMEVIQECVASGKRMLIFSQFTEMLKIIKEELDVQLGLTCFYLDGSTPSRERVELCQRFNEGEQTVFLISLKAGGTGLNLTGADTVILYDLWWNPAVEQQAADRAHRMGQQNVVQVIRLVTQGTIEEKMVELQQRKKNLIDEVIQPGETSVSSLTEDEIMELLMMD